jgi:hypothetical protein
MHFILFLQLSAKIQAAKNDSQPPDGDDPVIVPVERALPNLTSEADAEIQEDPAESGTDEIPPPNCNSQNP